MSIRDDSRHLYLQVIDQIKHDIEKDKYREGEKLPSEFQLSRDLGVSRATLREALRILEEDNIVVRKHGVGTYVKEKSVFASGIEQLHSVTDMIAQTGMTPGSRYLATEIIQSSSEDRVQFNDNTLSEIVEIERIRTADDIPVIYCIDHILPDSIDLENVHKNTSLLKVIEDHTGYRITYAVTKIEPVSFHEKASLLLDCQPDQSLLLLKQMHYNEQDEPVLYSKNYFRADKFSFYVIRKRI
ncbi:GntR family transcriptional regulator [Virgibacillus sp. MSP4-1]|uniref:GntR family transcriptional regulator n=1 Tax=Virgibacillus sp. MSP4-1 TaxID=2700081 RepID=UPI0003A6E712|nr:GntR family transcriptional regulator [Virgibacillus sp. MSP4-1]QHS22308.1 GntR family transcriptional regulator [Virgibacillus sp. MSP4-1]